MVQVQNPLFRYENNPDDELGRRLIASTNIQEGRLVFVERPFIAMQTVGNVFEGSLVCNYCFAFCGSPKQALDVISDPSCLQEITTTNSQCIPVEGNHREDFNFLDSNPHTIHTCKHKCGVVYCSLECQQDDWEWGGHKELCTGTIPEPIESPQEEQQKDGNDDIDSSNMDPLLRFKMHAMETNEIFLLVAVWLVRILKNDLPYNEDDNMNTHPYTDFQMNTWWDVKENEEATLKRTKMTANSDSEAKADDENLGDVLKQLCEESHSHLSQTLKSRLPCAEVSPWLSALGMARLIGSLEQNCLGIRRKHAIQRQIMEDTELRKEYHEELIQCLEGAGVLGDGDDDDSSCGCGSDDDGSDDNSDAADDHTVESDAGTIRDTQADNCETTAHVDADDSESQEGEPAEYSSDELASILADLKPDLTNNCQVDEWDTVIRPLDGVSHYSIATKMNHSCEPNVILVYKTKGWGRDHPLCAYIVALRDILPGEELTISYITSDDSYEERQAALANYGFICRCLKCEKEKESISEGGETPETETDSVDEDDLFGDDDDDEEDNVAEEDNLFGDDEEEEEDPFGEDDNGDGDQQQCDNQVKNEQLSGEERLSSLAERMDSILNKSKHLAIPLTYLAPASNYVIKLVSSLLHDISSEQSFDDNAGTIEKLLQQNMVAIRDRDFASCRIVGSDLELYLYNQLQSNGSWETPMHRASYWCASITASIGYAHEGSFLVSMKYLDKAIILGQDRSLMKGYFDYVELYASQMAVGPCPIAVECKVSDFRCPKLRERVATEGLPKAIAFPVEEIRCADESNKAAIVAACNQSESLVIRGLAFAWPAVKKWRKMDALAQTFGHRLVPIEVGSMSNDGGMKEAVVTFRQFVARYLSSSAQKDCWSLEDATAESNHHIAYLAQHPLLDQIPALCNDIDTNPCGVKPTNVNVWMGTGGTRTPLHFDTYDNLLVQLVGAKYVRLYKKENTSRLHVSQKEEGYGGQGNMSDLDCEREDFEKHPLAKDCSYTEVVLYPGDCLFIPSREWHYVRSLSSSISVNFWF